MRALLPLVAVLLAGCGGMRLEDRTTAPELPSSALEVVAELDHPPGNVAVSRPGPVLTPAPPQGHPPEKVVHLARGKPVPLPA